MRVIFSLKKYSVFGFVITVLGTNTRPWSLDPRGGSLSQLKSLMISVMLVNILSKYARCSTTDNTGQIEYVTEVSHIWMVIIASKYNVLRMIS